MKVLSFIDYNWLAYDLEKAKEYCEYSRHIVELNPNCKDAIDVYSQPFDSNLITLFNGWEKEKHEETEQWASEFIIYRNGFNKVEFTKCYWFYNIYFQEFSYSYFTKPKNLDNFITDCQRIGLVLEWSVK